MIFENLQFFWEYADQFRREQFYHVLKHYLCVEMVMIAKIHALRLYVQIDFYHDESEHFR